MSWLADRLPVDAEVELAAAIAAGAVRVEADGVRVEDRETFELPALETDLRAVRHHWATVAASRALDPGADDRFGFGAVAVSRVELARIQELQQAHLREVRAIAAASRTPEVAAELFVAAIVWSPRGK